MKTTSSFVSISRYGLARPAPAEFCCKAAVRARRMRVYRGLMNALVQHGELYAVVRRIRHGDGFARERDLRPDRLVFQPGLAFRGRGQIGNEYASPYGGSDAGLHIVHIEHRVVVGELLLENPRLHVRRDLRGRHLVAQLDLARIASGFSQTAQAPETSIASVANTSTGAATTREETPPERMAIISLSLDMRPRPTRIPTSTPNGMLSSRTGGSASTHKFKEHEAVPGTNQQFHQRRNALQKNDKCREDGRQ